MRPVFIGGCERSGTTMLGAMLGGHPDHLCVPEMQFKLDTLKTSRDGILGPVDTTKTLQKLARRSSFRIWELEVERIPPPPLQTSCRELLEWCVTAYGQKVGKPTPTVWVDHTPKNVRYAQVLLQLFPDARLVHIVRDGRAVAASLLPLDWGPNAVDRAAHYWTERIAHGLLAETLSPDRVVRVQYESLVQDPAPTLRHLCRAVGIPYVPGMPEADGFKVPRYTARQHALVGRAPDPKRVNAWEQQLTARQIEVFESVAAETLTALGYTPKFGLHARRMSRWERVHAGLYDLYRTEFVNLRRKKQRRRATVE